MLNANVDKSSRWRYAIPAPGYRCVSSSSSCDMSWKPLHEARRCPLGGLDSGTSAGEASRVELPSM